MNFQTIKTVVQKHRVPTIALASTVFFAGLFYVRASALADTQNSLETARQENVRLSLNISNASQLAEHLGAVQQAEKLIAGRLVSPGELAINQQYFYKIEADTGVKFLDLRQTMSAPPKGKGATTYVPVGFSVSLQGTYPKVLAFLKRLEQGSAYCRIVTANASPSSGEDSTSQVTLNLTVELLGRP